MFMTEKDDEGLALCEIKQRQTEDVCTKAL